MPVDVVFLEPSFPLNQREFARALHSVGARVIGIGERPKHALDPQMREWLTHYEEVGNVTSVDQVERAVRRVMAHAKIDRLEATVEAHVMCAAKVREACGIPGTSVQTTFLCRDKPSMKETLRAAGVPCAQSLGSGDAEEIVEFARSVGYPIIVKPRDAAGASATYRCDDEAELLAALRETGVTTHNKSVAIEEFIEGHEGFWDTLTIGGHVIHEFVCHYYPTVLEAMRKRWISPQFICTNRIDHAEGYGEVKQLGRRVIAGLDIDTSATHMEWFYGPKGLKFSEIACRPPGVGAWDLYSVANDVDIFREWAEAVVWRTHKATLSRRFSAGIINLRPDRDGRVLGYEGIQAIERAFGEWIIDAHFPPEGAPTMGVEAGYMANAWLRMKHPDYDELRRMLNTVGETIKVRAG